MATHATAKKTAKVSPSKGRKAQTKKQPAKKQSVKSAKKGAATKKKTATTHKAVKSTKSAHPPNKKTPPPSSKPAPEQPSSGEGPGSGNGAQMPAPPSGGAGNGSQTAAGQTASTNAIRIRMYRVGFGDCFLVSLPVAAGNQSADSFAHILFDCGVHAKGDIGTLGKAVDNIAAETGNKLAILVATHAHQDHIAGYDRYGTAFSKFQIGEVWLPWTWNPNDPQAVQLQKNQAALIGQLAQHFTALAATQPGSVKSETMAAIENLKGNPHAIALLKAGFGVNAKVRYLKAGDVLPGGSDGIPVPGLSVKFLGPPQSTKFLAEMNPPAGQHYLTLTTDGAEVANAIKPFADKWKLDDGNAQFASSGFGSKDESAVQEAVGSPLEALTFTINQALNNESVVALMIYRGQYLLFPGDAQYGNWEWWLENLQPDDILPMVRFFKVAHHGSLNATPVEALEKMSDGKFGAMVSTQSTPWASIPLVKLMQRVNQKTAGSIVRSDWINVTLPTGKPAPVPSKDAQPVMPSKWPAGFTEGEFWFDYFIDLS